LKVKWGGGGHLGRALRGGGGFRPLKRTLHEGLPHGCAWSFILSPLRGWGAEVTGDNISTLCLVR